MTSYLVVAIDGPAGSGKSTVARAVARRLGATLLDTGAIYRSVALVARREGVSWDDEPGLARIAARLPLRFALDPEGDNRVLLDDDDASDAIRAPEISSGASAVSAHPRVRDALLQLQREFARRGPVVAEGRDMGTVVFPAAEVKVFLAADPRVRARRRFAELRDRGVEITLEQVVDQQQRRDAADSEREVAPLRPATDAARIDTSDMSVEQVVERILALVAARAG